VKPPTKTIKVQDDVHRQLKLMAAKSGEHVYEVLRRLVMAAKKEKSNGR